MAPDRSVQTTHNLSPGARAAAAWFRQLARALRMSRLYRVDSPLAREALEAVTATLEETLAAHGSWSLRFAATEILLGEEPVVRVTPRDAGSEGTTRVTDDLPFLFYRDGIRRLTVGADAPHSELDAWVRILRSAGAGRAAHDDLVTLLWQANLPHVQIEAVPLEQTIYLSAEAAGAPSGDRTESGQIYAWSPTGSEIRAELGQVAGPQGLHRDTFDDWALPAESVEVPGAFAALEAGAGAAAAAFRAAWDTEASTDWTVEAPAFLRGLLALDDTEEMRRTLAHSTIHWLAAALQRVAWEEAQRALELLDDLDPDRSLTGEELAGALSRLDGEPIAERFDEGDAEDVNRFSAFTVALGAPAVPFCVDILARARKARVRAAAVTALCYLCADQPELLAPWLTDPRWHLVRNLVFVLGHIGGATVGRLLQPVARHPEPRVRRQLVQALGSVPPADRMPALLEQLDSRDTRLLATALNMLTRERDPKVARALLACVEAPDFESRHEGNQRALLTALGEVADDRVVPHLETLLHRGGWLARHTFQRVAVARTLRRIGTPAALAALEAGVRSRSEPVRAACLEALGARGLP